MVRQCGRHRKCGGWVLAFAGGLFLSCLFSSGILVFLLGVIIALCGIALMRC